MTDLLDPEEVVGLQQDLRRALLKLAGAPAFTPLVKLEQSEQPKTRLGNKVAALAEELEALGGCTAEQAQALRKHAAVSDEQARRSLDRLDSLERNKPTVGQVGRYGAIGALGGAAANILGNAIEHGSPLKGATPKARLLGVAAGAAKGALGGGALPLLRAHTDRRAEMNNLRNYMSQQETSYA